MAQTLNPKKRVPRISLTDIPTRSEPRGLLKLNDVEYIAEPTSLATPIYKYNVNTDRWSHMYNFPKQAMQARHCSIWTCAIDGDRLYVAFDSFPERGDYLQMFDLSSKGSSPRVKLEAVPKWIFVDGQRVHLIAERFRSDDKRRRDAVHLVFDADLTPIQDAVEINDEVWSLELAVYCKARHSIIAHGLAADKENSIVCEYSFERSEWAQWEWPRIPAVPVGWYGGSGVQPVYHTDDGRYLLAFRESKRSNSNDREIYDVRGQTVRTGAVSLHIPNGSITMGNEKSNGLLAAGFVRESKPAKFETHLVAVIARWSLREYVHGFHRGHWKMSVDTMFAFEG